MESTEQQTEYTEGVDYTIHRNPPPLTTREWREISRQPAVRQAIGLKRGARWPHSQMAGGRHRQRRGPFSEVLEIVAFIDEPHPVDVQIGRLRGAGTRPQLQIVGGGML